MNVTATLIGQIGTFAVLVWFVMKFLWKPMLQMMDTRNQKIADGLAAAERGRHELKLAQQQGTENMREAKRQAAELIAAANKRATEIVDEAKRNAQEEGARQLEAAQAEIEQEMNRARTQLQSQFAELVMAGAEKVLDRELNAANHGEFIEKLATKL